MFTVCAHEPSSSTTSGEQELERGEKCKGLSTNRQYAAHTYNQEVVVDDSTPTSVGCIAGVVPTVVPLHRGDGEDVVCHCDSVPTSDR